MSEVSPDSLALGSCQTPSTKLHASGRCTPKYPTVFIMSSLKYGSSSGGGGGGDDPFKNNTPNSMSKKLKEPKKKKGDSKKREEEQALVGFPFLFFMMVPNSSMPPYRCILMY